MRKVLLALLLTGCATPDTMTEAAGTWIGANIDTVTRYWGIPSGKFEMASGLIMYEWSESNTAVVPGNATSTATTYGGVTQVATTSMPPMAISSSCTLRFIANKAGTITETSWAGSCCAVTSAYQCTTTFQNPDKPLAQSN